MELALKRTLEISKFVWVLDFVNEQCVTINLFLLSLQVPFPCVVALISFILKFQHLFRVNFLYWKVIFPSLRVNLSRVNFQYLN